MSKPKEILKKALDGKSLTKEEIATIATNAQCSKLYAQKVLNGRFIAGEEAIKSSVAQTYVYAKDVIQGRWSDGEEILAKNPSYSFQYAQNVIYGRFVKGEKSIASDGHCSFEYAKNIIRGRFEKGEKAILEKCDSQDLAYYAKHIMEKRWPEAEDRIIQNSEAACEYACDFEYRWKEAEPEIIKNPSCSVRYAHEVLKGKWEEAEDIIATCSNSSIRYAKNINERFKKGEDAIIEQAFESGGSWNLREYITDVLCCDRWDKLENFIENYKGPEDKLAELLTVYSDCVEVNLPDFMHNRMLALAITNAEDWNIKRYFNSLEERENNEKLLLVKRFSLERLREIVGSINE